MYFLLEKREFLDCWKIKKSESQHRSEMKNRTHLGHLGHLGVLFPKRKHQINSRMKIINHPEGKKNIKLSIPEHWCICRVGSWSTSPALQGWPLRGKKPSVRWGVFSTDFSRPDNVCICMARCEHHFQDEKFAIEIWTASFLEIDGRLLVTIPVKNRKKSKSRHINNRRNKPPWFHPQIMACQTPLNLGEGSSGVILASKNT